MTLRALPLACVRCRQPSPPAAIAICDQCLGPLEPAYPDRAPFPSRVELSRRPANVWKYREWLPFEGEPVHSLEVGGTPLFEAPALADALGVGRVWIKNDAVSHPSLSFKDRVVAMALNAAAALGLDTVGCASTGNLANAVAAQAARAGLPAWIFIPHDLEPGKVLGTAVYQPRLVRVRGTYDDVNRLCAQVADRFGFGIVNVNLRSYYGEGSKTLAFEIAEQLGWRFPDAVVAPMAGGCMITRLAKGFREFRQAGLVDHPLPRLFGAQAEGCAPIVRLLESGGDRIQPVVPATIAKSLAIGNPADGRDAATVIRESRGWASAVSDAELIEGIQLLARTAGVFTETAGGVTVAAARSLAQSGKLTPRDEVVLCITSHGLKTVEVVSSALPEAPLIAPRLGEVAKLLEAFATC